MINLTDHVLGVAVNLVRSVIVIQKASQDRKEKVAEFLDQIADNVENVSASLKKGVYPHGACRTMLIHSEKMKDVIKDCIGEKKAGDLANQLKESWEIEHLYNDLKSQSKKEKQRSLYILDQAAGLFRATADLTKVSP